MPLAGSQVVAEALEVVVDGVVLVVLTEVLDVVALVEVEVVTAAGVLAACTHW